MNMTNSGARQNVLPLLLTVICGDVASDLIARRDQ
jgi:hypothetical protein